MKNDTPLDERDARHHEGAAEHRGDEWALRTGRRRGGHREQVGRSKAFGTAGGAVLTSGAAVGALQGHGGGCEITRMSPRSNSFGAGGIDVGRAPGEDSRP